MRIGIDARMFHKAGIRRYARELIENLSKLDQENEYFIYLSSKGPLNEFTNLNRNFNVVYLDAPLFSLKEQMLFTNHLRKDKLNLLHITFDFGAPLWPMKNLIVTVHDAFFGSYTFFRNFQTRIFYQMLTRYSVRRASRVLVDSNFVKDKLKLFFPNSHNLVNKTRVVFLGVGDEFSTSSCPEESDTIIRKKLNIRGKYLLCVGSFAGGAKNLSRIISSYSKLPDKLMEEYQLVIAGEIFDRVPQSLNMLKKMKSRKHILCLGYVLNEDLPTLYRNAEVFIFPSIHEGFGMPILEAMASGTPVITSNTTSMPEISGGAAALVDPYNVDEIRDAIINLITDFNLRKEMSEKGLSRAKKFSWSFTARDTLEIYKDTYKEAKCNESGDSLYKIM